MNRYVKRGSVGVSIFAVSAAAAAVLANPSENSAIAAAAGCPDVDVSFARGTNDSPGLGDVGRPSPTNSPTGWPVSPSTSTR